MNENRKRSATLTPPHTGSRDGVASLNGIAAEPASSRDVAEPVAKLSRDTYRAVAPLSPPVFASDDDDSRSDNDTDDAAAATDEQHPGTLERSASYGACVNPYTWTPRHVRSLLMRNNFRASLCRRFQDVGIDGTTFLSLTEALLGQTFNELEPEEINRIMELVRASQPHNFDHTIMNDPIHGHIEIHPLCMKIIDTPQFQRLRDLKQLGGCYYVFPGASHNRFEHSLGVYHLAGELVKTLQRKQPDMNISAVDVLCVQIAGLCHDLGHGPFSHLFDSRFIPSVLPNSKWRHEECSVMMFEHLISVNRLEPEFERYGLRKRDVKFIQEQIAGPLQENFTKNWEYEGRSEEKSFLYEIVANKRNGIDVDKWDYFQRDCYHLGIRNSFDHSRFIKFARILNVEGVLQICSRDKEVINLYDLFHTRSTLHRRAYQHKTTNIIELMITEALLFANDHILLPGTNGAKVRISDSIHDMQAYTNLTDSVLQLIMISDNNNLNRSKEIIRKIQRRQIYKCVGQSKPQDKLEKNIPHKSFEKTKTEIAALSTSICDRLELDRENLLDPDDIVLDTFSINYGMGEKNPIDHFRFYTKSEPDVANMIRRREVSQMLPDTFVEEFLRVYCKRTDATSLEIAERCFAIWCINNNYEKPRSGDLVSALMTPLKSQSSQPLSQSSPPLSQTSEKAKFKSNLINKF